MLNIHTGKQTIKKKHTMTMQTTQQTRTRGRCRRRDEMKGANHLASAPHRIVLAKLLGVLVQFATAAF